MNAQTYQLKKDIALVIVGPQACGKTRLAQEIASRYGTYQQIEVGPGWNFHLRDALCGQVDVLIIDGVPDHSELVDIKYMLTGSKVQVRQPYSGNMRNRPSPHIILCTEDADWIPDGARRFDVIDLDPSSASRLAASATASEAS